MSNQIEALGRKAYRRLYNTIRRTPWLNHSARRIMESEVTHKFRPYATLYNHIIKIKAAQYLHHPGFLEINITDKCNSRCIMCPAGVHTGNTIMAADLYEDLCRQALDMDIRKLIITGGEPLLDHGICDKIRFAKVIGFEYIHMFSNASLLTPEISHRILESGLDSMTWSVDSADKREYERIRRGLNFDDVIANIIAFRDIKEKYGREKPLTRINVVCLNENRNSRKQVKRFFSRFVDIVEIIDSHNFAGAYPENANAREYSQTSRYPCHILFYKLVLTPQGKVKKCSIDYSDQAIMGDVNQKTLQDIFESARFMGIKKAHLGGDYAEQGCANCTHRESWWVDY